jgi:hypothetical protein
MNEIVLAKDDGTEYPIVISRHCSPSEKHSANDLRYYLRAISNANFYLVTDQAEQANKEILLGESEHLHRLGLGIDYARLGDEGFIIKTQGDYLIIAGGGLRGTMYGAYTFLEKYLGCRWFSSRASEIPKRDVIAIGHIDDMEVPPLEYRDVHYADAFDADWAARNKLNSAFSRLDGERGGKVSYFPFVHSFDMLIPGELYDKHPEYFPLIGGKRVDGYVQRCLSNAGALKLAKERVMKWIQEHPEAEIVSISQNDTGSWCQCPECSALDEAEGSPSASILNFVNEIAEEVQKQYPDKAIDTLAYQYSRKPPRGLRPRENVIIRLCTIECCFSHSLEECDAGENGRFREDIKEWSRIAPKLYVWDYVTNFAHYIMPFPNLYVLKPNIEFFIRNNVRGIFEEGNYSTGGNGEFAELRAYLLAKLLWNPDVGVDKIMEDFLGGYYGKAAPPIKAYIELLHESVKRQNIHVSIYSSPTSEYLTEDIVTEAEGLLTEAEGLADDEEAKRRVRIAHLPIQYTMIERGFIDEDRRGRMIEKFLHTIDMAGITNISEGKTVEQYIKELGHEGSRR